MVGTPSHEDGGARDNDRGNHEHERTRVTLAHVGCALVASHDLDESVSAAHRQGLRMFPQEALKNKAARRSAANLGKLDPVVNMVSLGGRLPQFIRPLIDHAAKP